MEIVLSKKVDRFLEKQSKGDLKGIIQVQCFLKDLEAENNPTALKNCKKMQNSENRWRW